MPAEPGNLSDLGADAQAAWGALLAGYFADTASAHALAAPDDRTPAADTVDWGAFPVRIDRCLGSRERALRLLDWRSPQGDLGRAFAQEEYLEWRVVRDERQRIARVEMTTEFPEYWQTLAAYHPKQVIELVRRFSGLTDLSVAAIFGGINPFAPGTTPEDRRNGFSEAMLPQSGRSPWSPYNNGQLGMCFMAQPNNTLLALVALVLAAAFPYVGADDGLPLSGSEAIAATPQAAVDCRNSDPTVVGKVVELAVNGHLIALDDPIGVYILDVDHERLLTPDDEPVPREWFTFSRGSRRHDGQGLERSQRLVFEVPPGLGFGVEDLIDARTEQNIAYGGQLSDLVNLGVHVRVSSAGAVSAAGQPVARPQVTPCERSPGCAAVAERWQTFERHSANLLADVGDPAPTRGTVAT